MTVPHDCQARLRMLLEAIERNREHLLEHTFEEKAQTTSREK